MTPFGLFNLFFDEAVIDSMVEMTNLYAHRENGMTNFTTDSKIIRMFIDILNFLCCPDAILL